MREYGSPSNIDSYQVLIFPEGTDLSAKNLARSHTYSKDNNLRTLHNVLVPRGKGSDDMGRIRIRVSVRDGLGAPTTWAG